MAQEAAQIEEQTRLKQEERSALQAERQARDEARSTPGGHRPTFARRGRPPKAAHAAVASDAGHYSPYSSRLGAAADQISENGAALTDVQMVD